MSILFTMVCYFLLFSMYITRGKNKRNWVSVRLCDNGLPYTQGGKGGGGEGGGGTNYVSRRFFLKLLRITRITEKINKILTTITSILLSFDLRKSEVEGQKKRLEVGVIATNFKCLCFYFQMILTITEISKENHESRAVKIANHASSCYAQSRLSRLIWAQSRITLIGPIKRHGKPLCHPVYCHFG